MEAVMTFPGESESNTIPFPSRQGDGDTLGGRIWRARDALGYSLEDLACRLGQPEEAVGSWERDHAEPETGTLFRLADVLRVSPSWLVAGIGTPPPEPAGSEYLYPLQCRLRDIRQMHEQTGNAIAALEAEVARLLERNRG